MFTRSFTLRTGDLHESPSSSSCCCTRLRCGPYGLLRLFQAQARSKPPAVRKKCDFADQTGHDLSRAGNVLRGSIRPHEYPARRAGVHHGDCRSPRARDLIDDGLQLRLHGNSGDPPPDARWSRQGHSRDSARHGQRSLRLGCIAHTKRPTAHHHDARFRRLSLAFNARLHTAGGRFCFSQSSFFFCFGSPYHNSFIRSPNSISIKICFRRTLQIFF